MSRIKHLLGPMRIPFLILTPACVILGVGTAFWTTGEVRPLYVALALIASICAHISVNAFNEYFDFKSGLDSKTVRTPFSGGSGTLPDNPEFSKTALASAIVAIVITGVIGGYFILIRGWSLLLLGIFGVASVLTYTPLLARRPLLCLVTPGVGFGPVMVLGTHVALTGTYSWTALIASLVPFFLVNDLLLLNQFPDVDADRSIGRRNFPIVAGKKTSTYIYGAFLQLAYLSIFFGFLFGLLPKAALLGLATLPLAVLALIGTLKHGDTTEKLILSLAINVGVSVLTPALVAVGLLVS